MMNRKSSGRVRPRPSPPPYRHLYLASAEPRRRCCPATCRDRRSPRHHCRRTPRGSVRRGIPGIHSRYLATAIIRRRSPCLPFAPGQLQAARTIAIAPQVRTWRGFVMIVSCGSERSARRQLTSYVSADVQCDLSRARRQQTATARSSGDAVQEPRPRRSEHSPGVRHSRKVRNEDFHAGP